jgi:F-type H+-transporting ATPase subunit delta
MSPDDDRAQDYARAFYEAALERWLASLRLVVDQLEQHPDLHQRLSAPEMDFAQRQQLMDGILPADVDLPVRNLIYALMQRGDLKLLPEIAGALHQRARQAETGPIEVEVVSAIPLNNEQRQTLMSKLKEQHGTALEVHYRVDPAILGGLVVRVGDKLLDNSLATRLAAMRQTLGVISRQ